MLLSLLHLNAFADTDLSNKQGMPSVFNAVFSISALRIIITVIRPLAKASRPDRTVAE